MIEKLKPHAAYKYSGVPWLGQVPAHWRISRSKRLFSPRKDLAQPDDVQLSATQAYGVIPQAEYEEKVSRRVVKISMHLEKRRHVEKDDFVISMRSFQGGLERAWASGAIRSSYVVLKPEPTVDVGFFAYLFKSHDYIRALQSTADFIRDGQDLNFSNFCQVDLPLPPMDEQVAIGRFLDHANRRIDRFIRAKKKLVALLKEQKQAIIHRAVTRGLNPSVPMKDSGVPWLGEIPMHWEIAPFSVVADIIDPNPSHRNPIYRRDGFPFISTIEFTGHDDIVLETSRRVSESTVVEQERRCSFRDGSMAFSRKGTIGAVRILPPGIRMALLDSLCVINCKNGTHIKYMYRQIGSGVLTAQLMMIARGAALSQISIGRVQGLRIILPPFSEQMEIAQYVDEKMPDVHAAIEYSERQISLLRAYRTRLISDVVTGQLDVREVVKGLPVEDKNGGDPVDTGSEIDEVEIDDSEQGEAA